MFRYEAEIRLNQRRMSASLRLSSTCLASINEEGDDGGGVFTNGKLQDCTNLGGSTVGHRRHSSFSLEACRNRRPLNTTDTDVFEHQLTTESDRLQKSQSWSSLLSGSAFRSVSSESLNERNNDMTANQFTNTPNTRKNQRSSSFSAIPSTSYNQHFARHDPVGEDQIVNNENIEPKLRRASIQCEAVLTGGGSKKNQGIFKDVDLANVSQDMPSPLHAVLHGFKAPQSQTKAANMAEQPVQKCVQKNSSTFGSQSVKISSSSNVIQRRNSFNVETSLSPRGNERFYNGHSRTLSEADINVSRLSKGSSVPSNIHVLSRDTPKVNNYFAKRSPSSSILFQNMKNEKHHSGMSERSYGPRTYSDGNLTLDPRHNSFQNVRRVEPRTYTNNQRQQNGINGDRKKSEGNVFVGDRVSSSRSSPNGKTINKDNKAAETKSTVRPRESVENKDCDKDRGKEQEPNKDDHSCSDTEHEQNQTPSIQIPYHEKKFSIASDEGYVTSPPSTPCGRHAHSIVSDSSWISTDFDDTSSSCEPSPVHGPGKVMAVFLKRNDISHEYSKAKHSRRSSDYGSTSEIDRVQERECEAHRSEEGLKQDLYKTDSCASLPFRQTEV
ncbi:uncharacterized protein LOC124260342 isoform X2 [Haliotis rubra]|uniref:uncharacterized protein LOC124260342 isoform X2 n=1 Tax=Haliotis rubra TaxID=36100 RepID=UPI001EE5E74A|nr:uncharacterized protein LOC124260342 isoform X2 [Haliotis rubra]